MIFEEFKTIPAFEGKVQDLTKKSEDIAGEIQYLNSQFLQQEAKQIASNIKKVNLNIKKDKIGSLIMGMSIKANGT